MNEQSEQREEMERVRGRKASEIVTALRDLVAQIHCRCVGAYGAGDDGYQGEYEEAIQAAARAIVGVK